MNRQPTRATRDGRVYLDLQRLARRTRRSTQELLHLYALEAFLARLAASTHAPKLVLKGGVLLAAYGTRRSTRDIDLQGRYLANDIDAVLSIARDITSIGSDDGLTFHPEIATAHAIRESDSYHGVRVNLLAHLATAEIRFHVDINVGDPIWPPPGRVTIPGLLGRDIDVVGYRLSTVYAEKIVTAVDRGPTNTRWRDFADVFILSGRHAVDADELRSSIVQVATYRRVALVPLADRLAGWAETAQAQWAIWRRKQQLTETLPDRFADTLAGVIAFADPVITGQVAVATWRPTDRAW